MANILELYYTYVKTNPIQHTLVEYKVKFTKLWRTTPNTTPSTSHNNTYPSQHVIRQKPPKYNPQQYYYTNGSFIPLNEHGIGNTTGLEAYSPNNNIHIAKRLPGLPNILHAELYTLLITLIATKDKPQDTYIFTQGSTTNTSLIITSVTSHPNTTTPINYLSQAIVHRILWTKHNITIQKIKAHVQISSNKIVNQLANKGTTQKPVPTPTYL